MSLSLLVGNRLWGMIVCHNATPRPVSAALRGACQEIAEVVAARLFRMEAERRACGLLQARNRADALADALSEIQDTGGRDRAARADAAVLVRLHGTFRQGFTANPSAMAQSRPRR